MSANVYFRFSVCYCVLLLGASLGHLGWLLYQQTRVLPEYEQDPKDAYLHAIPTWLPIGFLFGFWACTICYKKVRADKEDRKDYYGLVPAALFTL